MKILIAVGASGGHIYPAVAVAEVLQQYNQVYYTGGIRGLERKILSSMENQLFAVRILPWAGADILNRLKALWLLSWSTIRSINFIKSKSIKVLLSSGSYSSSAAILAAVICRLPLVMLEIDCQPSITTRKFGRFAKCIALAHPDAIDQLPPHWKVKYTGIPFRKNLIDSRNSLTKTKARKELGLDQNSQIILIVAGSQGSQKIEKTVHQMISNYSLPHKRIFIASAGKFSSGDYYQLSRSYTDQFITKDYIENISLYYAACDLVISRAGAMTIGELNLWKKPAILIPIKQARGHQLNNAMSLIKTGTAYLLEESELNACGLHEAVEKMLNLSERNFKGQDFNLDGASKVAELVIEAGKAG